MLRQLRMIALGLIAVATPLAAQQRIPTVHSDPADQFIAVHSNAALANTLLQLESRIEQQNQEIQLLKASLARPGNASLATDEGEWEDVSNKGWTYKVGGRGLTEFVLWTDDATGNEQNYAEIRQVRLELAGKGYGVYDYRVQVDFEPEVGGVALAGGGATTIGSLAMKDVYLGIHEVPHLGYVRIGHFKVPFSHDQMLARRDMTFMERYPMADPNGFTPGREVGIAAFSHSADQNVAWGFGAFFDSISEGTMQRISDDQGLVTGGRITWTPYYDEPSDGRYIFHVGLGALYTHTQDGSGRFRQRPEIHEGPVLIDTGAINAGDYYVVGTEALLHWGPVYINHELMWAHVNDGGPGRTDLYSGYVETGWFLTGEHRNYDRKTGTFKDLKPFTNFWWVPGCVGCGAWEVAARWSFVDFTDSPNASRYNSLNLALNHYLTPNIRTQLNWIQPFTEGQPLGSTYSSIVAMRIAGYF